MRQNATPFYVRSQSRDRASQAKSAKLSGTNAPLLGLNDTHQMCVRSRQTTNAPFYTNRKGSKSFPMQTSSTAYGSNAPSCTLARSFIQAWTSGREEGRVNMKSCHDRHQ